MDYRDKCLIERTKGKDEWDNPINPEVIYDGPCNYQEGGTNYSRVFTTRNPTIYLPGIDAQVLINDGVTILTEFGREIKSVVKIVRDINMPWQSSIKITRIELKQAQGE